MRRQRRSLTPKACNIIADPFDRQPLVLQSKILWRVRSPGEPEDIETIVHGDDNDIFVLGEIGSFVEWRVCVAD